ncbi:MAG: cytochrome c-type biogenesis protein [Acidimicrobiia bacterium]
MSVLGVVLVAATALVIAGSEPLDKSPRARAVRLSEGLRCPVCQGLSIGESPAPIARDMVAEVRRRVEAGESDAQVRRAFVQRYGESVLLDPSGSWSTSVVLGLPVALLVAGLVGIGLALRSGRRRSTGGASREDRARVDEALARVSRRGVGR